MFSNLVLRRVALLSFAVLSTIALFASGASAADQSPRVVFYQGRITNDTGQPLNGSYSMTFTLYDALSGGVQMWTENQSSVSVQNGIFSVYLGSSTALSDTAFDTAMWLAVAVGGNTFSPRTRLAAAPYAYEAYRIGGLDTRAIAKTAGDTFTGIVAAETIVARTAGGLFIRDDGGNLGLYIKDGGQVGLGTTVIDAQGLQISAPHDQLIIVESDGTTDNKKWLFKANSRFFDILTADDAWSSWATAFTIGRTGTTVDTVAFPNGKVLVGGTTNLLNTKLTVVSTSDQLMIWDGDGTADNSRWVLKADGNWFEIITADDAWSSWAAAMRVGRNGITVDTIAFPNGNFVIGAALPTNKFSVAGAATILDTFAVGGTYGDSFAVTRSNRVGVGTKTPWGKLTVSGNAIVTDSFAVGTGGESLVVTRAGRVGVGIAAPLYGFHILHGAGSGAFVGPDASWSSGDTAAIHFGDGGALIMNDWNSDFVMKANKEIVLDPSTRVGIKTYSPTLAFEVSGGIKADSIIANNVISSVKVVHGQTGTGWGPGFGTPTGAYMCIDPRDYCPPGGRCQYKLWGSFGTITASSNIDVRLVNSSDGNNAFLTYNDFGSNETNMNNGWTSYVYNGEATMYMQISVSNAATDWTINSLGFYIRMEQ